MITYEQTGVAVATSCAWAIEPPQGHTEVLHNRAIKIELENNVRGTLFLAFSVVSLGRSEINKQELGVSLSPIIAFLPALPLSFVFFPHSRTAS